MTDDESTDDDATKSVATGGDTATIDLADLVDDLAAEAEALREQRAAAQDDDADDVDWPPEDWAGVADPVRAVEHTRALVAQSIDDFDGSEFVLVKARAGEAARASSLVLEDVAATGADPRSQVDLAEHKLVQVCVERVPADAPTTAEGRLDTMALEQPVYNWLRERVEAFNTYGTVSLSDF